MENLNNIKERYLKEPFERKLGHLASDLARISNFLDNPKNKNIVSDIIEESKFFIEWAAPYAAYNTQKLLAEIQPKLALWHRHLLQGSGNTAKEIEKLRRTTKIWSAKLIHISKLPCERTA